MHSEVFPISQGVVQPFNGAIADHCLYVISAFKFEDNSLVTNIPIKHFKTKISVYPLRFKSGDAGC